MSKGRDILESERSHEYRFFKALLYSNDRAFLGNEKVLKLH